MDRVMKGILISFLIMISIVNKANAFYGEKEIELFWAFEYLCLNNINNLSSLRNYLNDKASDNIYNKIESDGQSYWSIMGKNIFYSVFIEKNNMCYVISTGSGHDGKHIDVNEISKMIENNFDGVKRSVKMVSEKNEFLDMYSIDYLNNKNNDFYYNVPISLKFSEKVYDGKSVPVIMLMSYTKKYFNGLSKKNSMEY
jgi:hypothetical protein